MSRVARSFSLVWVILMIGSLGLAAALPQSARAAEFTVTTTRDLLGSACGADTSYPSDCSLRQALNAALAAGSGSVIKFNIEPVLPDDNPMPGYDVNTNSWTIILGDKRDGTAIFPNPALPLITVNNIIIDGDSQSIARGIDTLGPQIYIDGRHVTNRGGITVLNASQVQISRLGIINFKGDPNSVGDLNGVGIELFNATNTSIIGCSIGVGPDGLTAAANDAAGILIQGGSGNTIGGNNSNNDQFNIISGNTNDGIQIRLASLNNVIIGNRIGVNRTGTVAIPNGSDGVEIQLNSENNRIGSFSNQPDGDATLRNTIAGNLGYGVLINESNNNQVFGNWIGANNQNNVRLSNQLGGVAIVSSLAEESINNRIGGDTINARNIISGNNGPGISILGTLSANNVVNNNYIGIGFSNNSVVSNTIGVLISGGGDRNEIGSTETALLGNVISGNSQQGVLITGIPSSTSTDNIVAGNLIGVGPNGVTPRANGLSGVRLGDYARTTRIGSDTTISRNLIAYNNGDGIEIAGTGILSPTIGYNRIQNNTRHGISVTGSTGLTIQGMNDTTLTQVVGNGQQGITVSSTTNPLITYVDVNGHPQTGVNITSSAPLTLTNSLVSNNRQYGIAIASSSRPTIVSNDVISNTLSGIYLINSISPAIQSNLVERNKQSGIDVTNSQGALIDNNTIITSTLNGLTLTSSNRSTVSANIVSGNSQSGVSVIGSTTVTVTLNTLRSNIGGPGLIISGPAERVQASENLIELNKANGLVVVGSGTTRNITTTNNTIQYNTGSGIVMSGSVVSATIRANLVFSNTLSGIQLGNGGSSPHPQQVTIRNNSISQNGIANGTTLPISNTALMRNGIIFNPDTNGTPGVATNPNHDIDPPIESSLVVSQNGILRGKVLADGSQAACTTVPVGSCRIQIFNTSPQTRDGQGSELIDVPVTIDQTGVFTASLGFVPEQLALTATDNQGNTSEFGVFVPRADLTISPAQIFSAKPGDTITVTHTITNVGSISFDQLSFTATPQYSRWQISTDPSAAFALKAGETRIVTYTVTLPTGSDEQVRAGLTGLITVTAQTNTNGPDKITRQVADGVTVLQSVVLSFGSSLNGSGQPGTEVTYPHVLTNNGNITTTVQLGVSTTDEGLPAPTWTTTYTPTSVVLGPGISTSVIVKVKVAEEAQQGKFVLTNVTATPFVGGILQGSQVKLLTNKTTATLEPQATMFPNRTGDAAAGEMIAFLHTVQNTSNGTATFKLTGISSQGSRITFSSNTPGVALVNGDTFTISNAAGADTFTFFVTVQVDRRLLPGQKDIVTIVLTDASGASIGGASVQDTINITRGVIYPRLWLPLVRKP